MDDAHAKWEAAVQEARAGYEPPIFRTESAPGNLSPRLIMESAGKVDPAANARVDVAVISLNNARDRQKESTTSILIIGLAHSALCAAIGGSGRLRESGKGPDSWSPENRMMLAILSTTVGGFLVIGAVVIFWNGLDDFDGDDVIVFLAQCALIATIGGVPFGWGLSRLLKRRSSAAPVSSPEDPA
jgi:hypothetical protein